MMGGKGGKGGKKTEKVSIDRDSRRKKIMDNLDRQRVKFRVKLAALLQSDRSCQRRKVYEF